MEYGFDPEVTITKSSITLPRNCNQVQELAKYAKLLIFGCQPEHEHAAAEAGSPFGHLGDAAIERLVLFHTDATLCGLSAIALGTNATTVLRKEAEEVYSVKGQPGAFLMGSEVRVVPEKAVVANCSAVREWDSNGTVFGYRSGVLGHQAGEFGHNDFYPVVIAAQNALGPNSFDGRIAVRAMLCLDEIRGRLAEVFSLRACKIDHVLHGSIASAIVYGTLLRASIEAIESAVGMTVAHYTPWRAIRAGHQLSDSKGASAAISTEVAILSVHRAIRGFQGPKDIFRNPESPFRVFKPTPSNAESPFDLILGHSGDDFAIMGMHFKMGLYEHQSAGAIHGLITLMSRHSGIYVAPDTIEGIEIASYKDAVHIIGDPAKRNPATRQSADHSMVYIISTLIQKAHNIRDALQAVLASLADEKRRECALFDHLMLLPSDYTKVSLSHPMTRDLMSKISFKEGGEIFDAGYPEGIPTQIKIRLRLPEATQTLDSGLVMFPLGHCRNMYDAPATLLRKFEKLGEISIAENEVKSLIEKLQSLASMTAEEVDTIYSVKGGLNKLDALD